MESMQINTQRALAILKREQRLTCKCGVVEATAFGRAGWMLDGEPSSFTDSLFMSNQPLMLRTGAKLYPPTRDRKWWMVSGYAADGSDLDPYR